MKKILATVLAIAMLLCSAGITVSAAEGTSALPNAEVKNLGAITITEYGVYNGSGLANGGDPIDLQVAMEFIAKDTPEEAAANAYGNYTTDFFITINGIEDGSFIADGCYLAGNYGIFGWIQVPLDGMKINSDETYPVITSVGFDFKYVNICSEVKDFKCGIYFPQSVIDANPNMSVTLTLGLSEDKEKALETDFIPVDSYTYDVAEFAKKEVNINRYDDFVVESENDEVVENAVDIITDVINNSAVKGFERTNVVTATNVPDASLKIALQSAKLDGEVVKAMTFDVKPVDANGDKIANENIKSNITFRLPVDSRATETKAKVYHNGDELDGEYDVQTLDGKKFIEVSAKNFSSYGYELIEEVVPVAEVGGVEYTDLQTAINEAQDDNTITLLKSIELSETVTVSAGKKLTLDLNGKTISMADASSKAACAIRNNGNLTITDSSENADGKITFVSTTPSTSNSYSTSTVVNTGNLTVNGGVVENTTNGGASYAIDNAWYTEDTSVTINGGEITAVKIAIRQVPFSSEAQNVLTITGGTITGGTSAVQTHSFSNANDIAEVNISGGTLNGSYAYYTSYSYETGHAGTDIEITNGTFNGYLLIYNGNKGSAGTDFKNVSVSGGTFNGDVYVYTTDADGSYNDIGAVRGGTFAYDVSYYLADGYKLTANEDGTFTATEDSIWTYETDAGFYVTADNEKFGLMRFLFAVDTEDTIDEVGIKYIKANDIKSWVGGKEGDVNKQENISVFYGDVVGIPNTVTDGNYYAAAYIKVGDKYTWSEPQPCTPNWNQQFTNYQPEITGGEQ